MPWEQPAAPPPTQSTWPDPAARSTIVTSEPVLGDQPAGARPAGPEVVWAPPSQSTGPAVPGAEGLVYAGVGSRLVAWIIDAIIIGLSVVLLAIVLIAALDLSIQNDESSLRVMYATLGIGIEAVYFIWFWTGSRATPGMRVLGLQIGTAVNGSTLTFNQAVIRFLALGYPFIILAYVPGLALVSYLLIGWYVVLLITVARSPTHQGLHDRWAGSAIVQPATRASSGAAQACLVILALGVVVIVVSVIALIFLGSQISNILDEVGRSI